MNKFFRILTSFFSIGFFFMQPVALIPVTATNTTDSNQAESAQLLGSVDKFSATVVNGNARQVVGLFSEDTFAYQITQQPTGNPAFVSTMSDVVTQFSTASLYGSIGLVAHNNLAGARFFDLSVGDRVVLVYGDGTKLTYEITEIDEFQALSPYSPYSDFVDLSNPEKILSASGLFLKMYNPDGRLVMQTCIAQNGVDSWGRLFVVAEQVEDLPLYY